VTDQFVLDEHDVLTRQEGAVTAEADDELVMLDAEHGKYFGLNAMGRRIWEFLDTSQTPVSLRDTLVPEFDVAPEDCLADVLAFVSELTKAELVAVSRQQ